MDAEGLVLGVLAAMPNATVKGKKRLQKLAFFAKECGADASVNFRIHDFGPYSFEVSNAADTLSVFGYISESDEVVGSTHRYVKVYHLDNTSFIKDNLPESTAECLRKLNKYTSIELEVASTIRYFYAHESLDMQSAIDATKDLKPSKTSQPIVNRAIEALSELKLNNEG
jgi:uncharacterized protein YwgA